MTEEKPLLERLREYATSLESTVKEKEALMKKAEGNSREQRNPSTGKRLMDLVAIMHAEHRGNKYMEEKIIPVTIIQEVTFISNCYMSAFSTWCDHREVLNNLYKTFPELKPSI